MMRRFTINWDEIESVMLDMDGTLLDRHFDDHFWLEHVPLRYAEKFGGSLPEVKGRLYAMFRSQENTLNWTDLDYWSAQLGLDILLLKHELIHLIKVHPSVIEFLQFLTRQQKPAYLVTNAHRKTLTLKLATIPIGSYFTAIVSAHQIGLPKEDPAFWSLLQKFLPYSPEKTLLAEDSETNLRTAKVYGIRWLIHVGRFSSQSPAAFSKNFPSIRYFSELLPRNGMTVTV